PIADVVLDKVLARQPKSKVKELSALVSKVLSQTLFGSSKGGDAEAAIGFFLTQWIELETAIRRLVPSVTRFRPMPVGRSIEKLQLSSQLKEDIGKMNRLRNELVHGIERPNAADLYEAGNTIRDSILPAIKAL